MAPIEDELAVVWWLARNCHRPLLDFGVLTILSLPEKTHQACLSACHLKRIRIVEHWQY
jgi:hypothetical protein